MAQSTNKVSQRTQRKGQLVTPVEPMFVTLTGLPANRSPFRIVRSDKVEDLSKNGRAVVERADKLFSIQTPTGISEDDVQEYVTMYGIT